MSAQEEQRKLKQKFLVSQIIDAGYDASEFSEFLGKKKENGTRRSPGVDIDQWTYDELISVAQAHAGSRRVQAHEGRAQPQ